MLLATILLTGCLGTQPPAPAVNYGLRGGADSAGMHIAEEGDTVWKIAERYRLSMQDIIYVNGLNPPYSLMPGEHVKLPPPAIYKVRPNDTLYAISRTFSVDMTQVARQNNLRAPYALAVGQELRLPSVVLLKPPQPVAAPPVAVRRDRIEAESLPAPRMAAARPGAVERGAIEAEPLAPPPAQEKSFFQQPFTAFKSAAKPAPVFAKAPPRSASRFAWPVDGKVISTYGPKPGGLHNDGINIKAPADAPVRAAENGVVVYAGNQLKGFGNLVLIRHEDRWMTAYGHLARFHVHKGDIVRRGQTIGTVGMTGSADAPQLHFEIRRGTDALNPALYLARQGS